MTGSWERGVIRRGPPDTRPCVIKLGGSLLANPVWPALFAELIQSESRNRNVLVVVGGGAIVDGLRALDAAHPLRQERAHRLAIELLRVTGRIVAEKLGLPLHEEPADVPASVLDVPAWLDRDGRFLRLPVGWHVTSDSIAAIVAAIHGCDLVLAKSVPPPVSQIDALEPLVRAGWIDEFFAEAAAPLACIGWASPASVPPPGVGWPGSEGGRADRGVGG